jgi:two-component system, NtrC family, sensor kinase
VLIVEDSTATQMLLGEVVRQLGAVPHLAADAQQARTLLALQRYACALIDRNLPDGDGFELIRQLVSDDEMIQVVVITGQSDLRSAVDALRVGAMDYVVKPFTPETLRHRVQLAIERRLFLEERANAKQMLLLTDRMAALGTMAAGVAHELNNPLSYVLLNLELVGAELRRLHGPLEQAPASVREDVSRRVHAIESRIETVRKGADRVCAIVKDLKAYSRGDEDERSELDPRDPLEMALKMTDVELRKKARVEVMLSPMPVVRANRVRLEQVFVNLLLNAAQAISGERAGNVIRVRAGAVDGGAVIEVVDSGSGIAEEIREKIFEPFFTTKPAGVGTGLGLPICREIVAAFGGAIEVDSVEGQGSTFRVRLPAAQEGAVAAIG